MGLGGLPLDITVEEMGPEGGGRVTGEGESGEADISDTVAPNMLLLRTLKSLYG